MNEDQRQITRAGGFLSSFFDNHSKLRGNDQPAQSGLNSSQQNINTSQQRRNLPIDTSNSQPDGLVGSNFKVTQNSSPSQLLIKAQQYQQLQQLDKGNNNFYALLKQQFDPASTNLSGLSPSDLAKLKQNAAFSAKTSPVAYSPSLIPETVITEAQSKMSIPSEMQRLQNSNTPGALVNPYLQYVAKIENPLVATIGAQPSTTPTSQNPMLTKNPHEAQLKLQQLQMQKTPQIQAQQTQLRPPQQLKTQNQVLQPQQPFAPSPQFQAQQSHATIISSVSVLLSQNDQMIKQLQNNIITTRNPEDGVFLMTKFRENIKTILAQLGSLPLSLPPIPITLKVPPSVGGPQSS